jgi:hypothetical protein
MKRLLFLALALATISGGSIAFSKPAYTLTSCSEVQEATPPQCQPPKKPKCTKTISCGLGTPGGPVGKACVRYAPSCQ